jgi:hypothetical protein
MPLRGRLAPGQPQPATIQARGAEQLRGHRQVFVDIAMTPALRQRVEQPSWARTSKGATSSHFSMWPSDSSLPWASCSSKARRQSRKLRRCPTSHAVNAGQ